MVRGDFGYWEGRYAKKPEKPDINQRKKRERHLFIVLFSSIGEIHVYFEGK